MINGMLSTNDFTKLINKLIDKKIKNPFVLGKIDPNYSTGNPRVLFDGEVEVSKKRYPHLASYKPVGGDRVAMLNLSGTHLIIGAIGSYRGSTGSTSGGGSGAGLQYTWDGTRLGVKREDEASFTFMELRGAEGKEGIEGRRGEVGPRGLQGSAGPQGPKGDTGSQGPQGLTGPAGPKGDTGAQGPQGETGAQGSTGPRGLTGATGAKGDKGDKGDTGDTGPQGESGITTPANGMFTLSGDSSGNLYAYYSDLATSPPSFEVNSTTGDIYYIIPE